MMIRGSNEMRSTMCNQITRNSLSVSNQVIKGKARASNVSPFSIRFLTSSTSNSKPATTTTTSSTSTPLPSTSSSSSILPTTTQSAISLLKSQPSHYILSSINGRVYLLSKSDVITVPHLKNVNVGDILQLDRIHEVGSRDYTLRAQQNLTDRNRGLETSLIQRFNHGIKLDFSNPNSTLALQGQGEGEEGGILETSKTSWSTKLLPNGLAHNGSVLDEEIVSVKVVVLEHTKGKLEKIEKTKRRKGYKKTIHHKGWWTKLRVEGIEIGNGS